jgi:hypothetical protein
VNEKLCARLEGKPEQLRTVLEETERYEAFQTTFSEGVDCLLPEGSLCEKLALRQTLLTSEEGIDEVPADTAAAARSFIDACHTLSRDRQICLRDRPRAFVGPCSEADAEGALFRAGGYNPPLSELATPEMCTLTREEPGELLLKVARRYPFTSPLGSMYLASQCALENRDVCDRAAYESAMLPSMAVADGVVTEADVRRSMKKQADECRKLSPAAQVCERLSYRVLHHKECAQLRSDGEPD